MKRTLHFVFLFLLLSSCKKNYLCRCSVTIMESGIPFKFSSSVRPVEEKLTKKQAKAVCKNQEEQLFTSYGNLYSNNGTTTFTETIISECVVE